MNSAQTCQGAGHVFVASNGSENHFEEGQKFLQAKLNESVDSQEK